MHTWPISGNTKYPNTTQILGQHTRTCGQPRTQQIEHAHKKAPDSESGDIKHRTQNAAIHPRYRDILPIVIASNTPSKPDTHKKQMSIYPTLKSQAYTYTPYSDPTKTSKIKPKRDNENPGTQEQEQRAMSQHTATSTENERISYTPMSGIPGTMKHT